MKMTPVLGLLVCLTFPGQILNSGQAAEKPVDRNGDDQILKRFVEECVLVTPGEDPFPKEFQIGGLNEGPFSRTPRPIAMSIRFRISRYEVTQELYETVAGTNPSRWKGPRNSVEMVSFQDAERFCSRLTVLLRSKNLIGPDEIVRLPSEAEWEYCCRAGTTTRYSFGDSAAVSGDVSPAATILNDYAWHTGNAAGNDPAVGSLKPNPWGLYDMHGYLWEFVSDPYTPSPNGSQSLSKTEPEPAQNDANAAESSPARTIRGGSWRDKYPMLTSAYRLTLPDHAASDAIGIRCVISDVPQSPSN